MTDPVRKIAFILPNFQAGGAERVMVTVANHLDRQKFQPVIIVFHDHGPLRDIVASDVTVISLNVQRVRQGIFPLARAVRAVGAEAVISTMAHLNMVVLLSKFFMPLIPVIVREAVTPSYFSGSFLKRSVLTAGYFILYPWADRILSPTQMVFDEMPWFFRCWPRKLQRIFNPVNTALIQDAFEMTLKSSLVRPSQRLFVGAGRLVDQKGFDRLIEALKGWRNRDDWRLIILGEGPDLERLEQLKTQYGLHQVTLAGFESKPWRYFAIADAFVLPSRHEGLPNVALEALALGTPVIASDSAGGIAEIEAATISGTVSLSRNMEEFTSLMNKAVSYQGALPRPSLLPECFSLPHVVASYEQVFTDVLKPKA